MGRMVKIWFSMLLLALCGCRTVPTGVDVHGQRVHTNVVESVVRDSVFLLDSIFLHVKADTVYLTKYRTLYKERVVRDTVVMCDTLYRERVVTKEKRVLPSGKSLLIGLLLFAVVLLGLKGK